jgi:hypothetical protein
MSERFDPGKPSHIDSQVRINTGEFEGYIGRVTRLDDRSRTVYFTITVFQRPVELRLDYDTAAQILDIVAGRSAEPVNGLSRNGPPRPGRG